VIVFEDGKALRTRSPRRSGLRADLDATDFRDLGCPLVNNWQAREIRTGVEAREGVYEQVPNRCGGRSRCARLSGFDVRRFVEVGAGAVLTGLLRNIDGSLAGWQIRRAGGFGARPHPVGWYAVSLVIRAKFANLTSIGKGKVELWRFAKSGSVRGCGSTDTRHSLSGRRPGYVDGDVRQASVSVAGAAGGVFTGPMILCRGGGRGGRAGGPQG